MENMKEADLLYPIVSIVKRNMMINTKGYISKVVILNFTTAATRPNKALNVKVDMLIPFELFGALGYHCSQL